MLVLALVWVLVVTLWRQLTSIPVLAYERRPRAVDQWLLLR
jgi:hypothetical protein